MFTPLLPLADLPPGAMKARDGVLVIHAAEGELHSLDNACPHQGYPLVQGQLCGKLLTCSWHNFKFDITNGACVMGEEAVRTHEVRVVDGMIEVQRSVGIDVPAAWASLSQAMARHQQSRIAREVARLLSAGVPAPEILAWGAVYDADRGEYGPGHGMALCATLAGWLRPGEQALEHNVQLVAEGLDLCARTVIGLPVRTRPGAESASPEEPASRAELRRRVEKEDAVGAEAIIRGMVASGGSREAWETTLYPLVTDHFLDFGHDLIYIGKLFDLWDAASPDAQTLDALLGTMIYGIANGTREDTLPPWAGFRKRCAGAAERIRRSREFCGNPRGAVAAELAEIIAHGSPGACFDAVLTALCDGHWGAVVDALSHASSVRLVRFDPSHDSDPTLEEGWLDVTHRLTTVNAVRRAVARWADPECARLVLMAAHFVNLAKALDLAELPPGAAGDLARALRSGDAEGAAASVTCLGDVDVMRQFVLEGHAVRPVFYAHHVKTLVAAEEEATHLGDLTPLRGVARFLACSLQERLTRRFAHQAVRLIRDGKPPRGLTG